MSYVLRLNTQVILANGAKLVTVDLMAPNGIVQELQKPLWPQVVNNITELIYKHKALTNFTSLLKKSGVDLTGKTKYTSDYANLCTGMTHVVEGMCTEA